MRKVLLALVLIASLTSIGATIAHPTVSFAREETAAAAGTAAVSPEMAEANAAADAAYSANQAAAGNAVVDAIGEGFKWLLGLSLKLFLQIFVWIFEILIGITTIVLAILGTLFNYVINQMVVEMGKYVTSSTAEGVRVAWGIMRDIANIAIIGGLVAIAIGTILHLQNVNIKNVLAKLLIGALLVNFSYFFAGAVIDSSNFLATKIYESVISADKQCVANKSCNLASTFMELVQIQGLRDNEAQVSNSLFDPSSYSSTNGDKEMLGNGTLWNQLLFNILLLIFELVTIFIFLSAITLLMGRFVALILLLITSPVGIVAFMLPATSKYAKEWWEALFTQAFFAPVYFLLVGFSFTIIRSSKDAIFNATASGETTIGLVLTFIVAAIFMLQSLKIAKQMSEKASQFADIYKAADKLGGWAPKLYATGVTTGGKFLGALAARETIGRFGDWATPRYRELAARNRWDQNKNPMVRGADRWVQERLGKMKSQKFFGFDDFGSVKDKRKAREVELGEVGKDETQKAELEGRWTKDERKLYKALKKKSAAGTLTAAEQDELDALRKKDPKTLTSREAARLAELAKKLTVDEKKTMEELDERKREGGALGKMNRMENAFRAEYDAGRERLKIGQDRLEELRARSKSGTLLAHEKAELQNLEKLDAAGKVGKEARLETWSEFWDRQEARGELGRKHLFKGELDALKAKGLAGTLTAKERGRLAELENAHPDEGAGEDQWAYHERMDAAKLDGKNSYRKSRTDAEAIYASISSGFWEREYDKNPRALLKLAKILPNSQWLEVRKDPKIRRDIKNEMIKSRYGVWAQNVRNIQRKVDSGEFLEGGEVYGANTLALFNDQKKNIPTSDEMQDLLLSDAIFDESTGERFQDLRKLAVFPQVFSSSVFADIKDKKLLPTTEQRDFGSEKRRPLDRVRDQQAGAYMLFGLQSRDHLPYEDGTVNYHGAERAVKWAEETLKKDGKTQKLIDRAKADPTSVSQSDLKLAEDNQRYAQMVIDAQKDGFNPLQSEVDRRIAGISEAEYREYEAKGIKREELRDAKRLQAMTEAKNRYLEARQNGTLDDPATREAFLRDPANFAIHRFVQTEEATRGYYRGKNPREIKAIFNNRTWWSTNTPIGVDADQLQSLEGQDIAERQEFFAQLLTRGDDSMIANYAGNEHMKSIFGWPTPERIRRINLWRQAMNKAPLPEVFSEEAITASFGGEASEPPTGGGPSGGGGPSFTPSGGGPRRPAPSAPEPADIPDFTPPSDFSPPEPPEDADTTFTERQAADIAEAEAAERNRGGVPIDPGSSSNDYSVAPTDEAPVVEAPVVTPQAAPTQAAPEPALSPEDYFGRFNRDVPYSEDQIQKAQSYMSDWTDDQIVTLPPRIITLALPGIQRPSTVLKILERYGSNPEMRRSIVAGFQELDRRGKLTGDIARMVRSWENPS